MTNAELEAYAEELFQDFLASSFDGGLTSSEVTILTAKLAARFATYAGDERDV